MIFCKRRNRDENPGSAVLFYMLYAAVKPESRETAFGSCSDKGHDSSAVCFRNRPFSLGANSKQSNIGSGFRALCRCGDG
ncbi:hypothetical protein A7X67_00210 [Clostridium sp. W14A]|nr:hypothetical protein A7X67_00210 [Clostridium sp. W14A]